jgi:hypothetical protein
MSDQPPDDKHAEAYDDGQDVCPYCLRWTCSPSCPAQQILPIQDERRDT